MMVNQKRKNNFQNTADTSYVPVPVPRSLLTMNFCMFIVPFLQESWCVQQSSVASQHPCGCKPRMLVSQSTKEPEEV